MWVVCKVLLLGIVKSLNFFFLFQALVDLFLTTSRKVRATKMKIFIERIALLFIPDEDSVTKEKVFNLLSKNCFNTDRLDDCIQFSKEAIDINSENKEVI